MKLLNGMFRKAQHIFKFKQLEQKEDMEEALFRWTWCFDYGLSAPPGCRR